MVYKRPVDEDAEDSTEFARLLEESSQPQSRRSLRPGERVRSEVLSLGRDQVIVSTGTLHDGFVPRGDFLDENGEIKVKVGDKLDLYVTQVRGAEIYLSPNPSARAQADDLADAYHRALRVEGRVESTTNGGFRVSLRGKLAFCPVSQIDTKFVEKLEDYVGKRFDFRITQYSERNLVVSRRRVLEEDQAQSQTNFLQQHQVGDQVSGVVSRLEKFGAFIELAPGLEGLAHISELSWSRVNEPSEVVEVGQQVAVKILKVEPEGGRIKISLSLKQIEMAPWLALPPELEPGKVLPGKVTRLAKFGAFVELFPGLEGLVPLSEMSFTKRILRPEEVVKEGERILVLVKDVDATHRRISLSIKEAGEDPWAEVERKFPVGRQVKGKLERREAYGLFIQLEEGVVGLFPKSKAAASGKFPYDRLRPGEEVVVRVADLRPGERKISLEAPDESGADDWKAHLEEKAAKPQAGGKASLGLLGEQLKAALEKKKPS